MDTTEKKPMSMKMKIIIGVIIVVIIGGVVYIKTAQTPAQKQAQENKAIVTAIGTLMLIPTEQPIIASINDAPTLIKEQAFYNGSQNGDKLVIFPQAQKAIIYSPSRKIIVNSGPFIINQGQQTQPTPTPVGKK